jgi:hypothetical protein
MASVEQPAFYELREVESQSSWYVRLLSLQWLSWPWIYVIVMCVAVVAILLAVGRVVDPIFNPTYSAGLMCVCNYFQYDPATNRVVCTQIDAAACPEHLTVDGKQVKNPAYPCVQTNSPLSTVTMQDCIDRCPDATDCSQCVDAEGICQVTSAQCKLSVPS